MFWQIAISILIHVHVFFVWALVRKNFSVIDIAWGLGPIIIAIISYLHNPLSLHNALILFLVMIWGLRLTLFIMTRNRGKGEDPRYTKFRNLWGRHAKLQAYFKIFLLQGILMVVISLPVSVGMMDKKSFSQLELSFVQWFGLLVWASGFAMEVWSDFYLFFWRKKPENKNKICMSGPWAFCRFPNYLGEITLWYGIYLLSFQASYFWTILGPMTLHFFIVKITGVAPIEEKYLQRKEYQEYAQRVPRFIKLPF